MAGWVPTEEEPWRIESLEAFEALLQGAKGLGEGLLFGAGLRRTSRACGKQAKASENHQKPMKNRMEKHVEGVVKGL